MQCTESYMYNSQQIRAHACTWNPIKVESIAFRVSELIASFAWGVG